MEKTVCKIPIKNGQLGDTLESKELLIEKLKEILQDDPVEEKYLRLENWFNTKQAQIYLLLAFHKGRKIFGDLNPKTDFEQIKDEIKKEFQDIYTEAEGNSETNEKIDYYDSLSNDINLIYGEHAVLDNMRKRRFKQDMYSILFFSPADIILGNKQSHENARKVLLNYISEKYKQDLEEDIETPEILRFLEDREDEKIFSENDEKDNIRKSYMTLAGARKIVNSDEDLNAGIAIYKAGLYKRIARFLNSLNTDKNFKIQRCYNKDGELIHEYIEELMYEMKNYLINNKNNVLAQIFDQFGIRYKKAAESCLLLDAVEAYINLSHFDEVLKEECGDVIGYDKKMSDETSYKKNGKIVKKYFIGKDKSHAKDRWTKNDFADALAKTTRIEKLFLGTLKYYRYLGNPTNDTINQSSIAKSWQQLVIAADKIVSKDAEITKVLNAIRMAHDDLGSNIPYIFKSMFANTKIRTDLIDDLLAKGLTSRDLDVLYSLYVQVISNKNGILNIEKNNIRTGISRLGDYLKSEILYGIIDHSYPVTYMTTRYNPVTQEYETKTISRNSTLQKSIFDFNESLQLNLQGMQRQDDTYYTVNLYDMQSYDDFGMKISLNIGTDRRLFLFKAISPRGDSLAILLSFDNKRISVTPLLTKEEQLVIDRIAGDKILNIGSISILDDIIKEVVSNNVDNKNISQDDREILEKLKLYQDSFESNNHINNVLTNFKYGIGTGIKKEISDGDKISRLYQKALLEFMEQMLNIDLTSEIGLETLSVYKAIGPNNAINKMLVSTIEKAAVITAMNDFFKSHLDINLSNEENDNEQEENRTINLGNVHWGNFMNFFRSNKDIKNISIGQDSTGYCFNSKILRLFDWDEDWFEAEGLINGVNEKSTTKNSAGDLIANNRPTDLSSEYSYVLALHRLNNDSAAHRTLFVTERGLLDSCIIDQDSVGYDGTGKAVDLYNTTELLFHDVIHNFWNTFIEGDTKGKISVIPTTYADKTTFYRFVIDATKKLKSGKTLMEMNEDDIIELYKETIGSYCITQYNAIRESLSKLYYFQQGLQYNNAILSVEQINNWLKTFVNNNDKSAKEQFYDLLLSYNETHEEKLNIDLNEFYRKNGDHLCFNELEYYYGEELYSGNLEVLKARFNLEKRNYLSALLTNNVNFFYDSKILGTTILQKMLNSEEVFNALITDEVIKEIVALNSSLKNGEVTRSVWKEYFLKKWFKNGRMILAIDQTGKEIKEIFTENDLENAKSFTLNPILEKYFYIDTLCSLNIRYAFTGSETADPLKAKLNMVKEFNHESKTNSINIKRTEEETKFLNAISGTGLLKELQHIDLCSLGIMLKDHDKFELEIEDRLNILKGHKELLDHFDELDLDAQVIVVDYRVSPEAQVALTHEISLLENFLKNFDIHFSTLKKMYDKMIYRVIATSEGSQYKRHVIYGATRTDLNLTSLTGSASEIKVAIIEDTQAPVYTPNGTDTTEDANDGSAEILALQSILENGSLGPNAVGYTNKKPIWYHYDRKTGTYVLLKFATFSLTNAIMLLTGSTGAKKYNLFKKLTNLLWKQKYNLLNSVAYRDATKGGTKLDFKQDILFLIPGLELIYREGGSYSDFSRYSIKDMIENNGIYYTIEDSVNGDKKTRRADERYVVAQVFDEDSKSMKSIYKYRVDSSMTSDKILEDEGVKSFFSLMDDIIKKENLHTINSIFELHEALGGIYTLSKENGRYVDSETSNWALARFVNNVCEKKIKQNPDGTIDEEWESNRLLTQEYYYLPLKHEYIGYAANPSAVKRGLFNVNPEKRWTDDEKLLYITLSAKGLGIQGDMDHTADEAEASEPTQVIASLDAGGYTHDVAKLAFRDIGNAIMSGLKVLLGTLQDALQKARNADVNISDEERRQLTSRIKDIFAREFIKSFRARNSTDLSAAIIKSLKEEFLISEDHSLEEFKVPLSDPNLFSNVIILLASAINRKGIKRKYPGLGTVMRPGYKIALMYHIGEYPMTYQDVVREAYSTGFDIDSMYHIARAEKQIEIDGVVYNDVHVFIDNEKTGVKVFLIHNGNEEYTLYQQNIDKLNNLESVKLGIAIHKLLGFNGQLSVNTNVELGLFDALALMFINKIKNLGFKDIDSIAIPSDNYIKYSGLLPELENSGKKYLLSEIYKIKAIGTFELENILTQAYLQDILDRLNDVSIEEFVPTDIVNIERSNGETTTINLEEIEDYYDFKEYYAILLNLYAKGNELLLNDTINILLWDKFDYNDIDGSINQYYAENKIETPTYTDLLSKIIRNKFVKTLGLDQNIRLRHNVMQPRILRPQLVMFKYTIDGDDQIHFGNIYDLKSVRDAILSNIDRNKKRDRKLILTDFNNIDDAGEVLMCYSDLFGTKTVKVQDGSLVVLPAELMMSNVHATDFLLKGRTLYEMQQNFTIPEALSLKEFTGDIALISKNGATSIFFEKPKSKDVRLKYNRLLHITVFEDGIYKIKALSDEQNEPIFDIGISVDASSQYQLKTDKEGKKYIEENSGNGSFDIIHSIEERNGVYYVNNEELVVRDGKVFKNVYFVKYTTIFNDNKKQYGFFIDKESIYNLPEYIKKQLRDKYIADIINGIANNGNYMYLLLNNKVKYSTIGMLKNILKQCVLNTTNNKPLYNRILDINIQALEAIINQKNPNQNTIGYFDLFELNEIGLEENGYPIYEEIKFIPTNDNTLISFREAINNELQKLHDHFKYSFNLSTLYIASRIPAQSLLSYMKMKLVGYLPIAENECMVSHWQTLLQGSDYDIDKSYITGYSFDGNGLFKDWSPLFDYSSERTLEESLKLPTPSGITINLNSEASIDIDPEFEIYKNLYNNKISKNIPLDENEKVLLLKVYTKILNNMLNILDEEPEERRVIRLSISNVEQNQEALNALIKDLLLHEKYIFMPEDREDIYKNSIQSRIQQVSGNIKNMPLAYSEISLSDLSKISETSSKGALIYGLTAMNPATKLIMLKLNMDGKAVIGISAIGEKNFMNLSYYYNEGIRKNSDNKRRHLYFEQVTTRIQGRASGSPILRVKTTIADTNYYGILNADDLKDRFIYVNALYDTISYRKFGVSYELLKSEADKKLISDAAEIEILHNKSNFTQADLMISQLLSAATDNAKELILNKINANKDFANIYLHLLILGYDIKDITSFMISPAVDVVVKLQAVNSFDENINTSKVEDAIERAKGRINIYRFLNHDNSRFGSRLFLADFKTFVQWHGNSNEKFNFCDYVINTYGYNSIKAREQFNGFINQLKENLNKKFGDEKDDYEKYINNISQMFDYYYKLLSEIEDAIGKYGNVNQTYLYMNDIEELESLHNQAEELRILGSTLGWNKEVNTSYSDFLSKINALETSINKLSLRFIIFDNKGVFDEDATLSMIKINKRYITNESITDENGNEIKSPITEDLAKDILTKAQAVDLIRYFNFNKFVNDAEYRRIAIDYFDLIKYQYNILDLIWSSPIMNKVLIAYDLFELLIKTTTIKGLLVSRVKDRLREDGVFIDNKIIKKLESYVEELLISNYLNLRTDKITFPINKGQRYYDDSFKFNMSNVDKMQPLDSYSSIASFKHWFEHDLLLQIRDGRVLINSKTILVDKGNDIIKYFTDGREFGKMVKKLIFNAGEVDTSTRTALIYSNAKQALKLLPPEIQQYIFLYSLLVSNNKPGNDRLTKLFTDMMNDNKSILYDYLRFIGEKDHMVTELSLKDNTEEIDNFLKEIGYSIDDAKIFLAPMYYKHNVKNSREEIIRYKEKGVVGYYRRKKNNYNGNISSDFEKIDKLKFLDDSMLQMNFSRDGIMFHPDLKEHNMVYNGMNTGDKNLIKKVLIRLLYLKKLKLFIEC